MSRKFQAAEQLSLEDALKRFVVAQAYAKTIKARLDRIRPLASDAVILDVGAAQGRFLAACAQIGLRAVGVEPWGQARETASRLAEHLGVTIELHAGVAEKLPVDSESVDIVHACSVIEHVNDAQEAFNEAYRVLKPGGLLWFYTASSMCPRQGEIGLFPLFGWYPNWLKLRIMKWAMRNRPDLIGHTETPAIHWFTPWKARRMLKRAGFSKVYDRWDLRLPSEGGHLSGIALRIIKSSFVTKILADILISDCSYAAVKETLQD